MNQKYKQINERLIPYEVLFIALFFLYLFAPVRGGDDAWFITGFFTGFDGNLPAYLRMRYETWSTRLLLEAYTLLLLYLPVLYRISMPLWVVSIAVGLHRILRVDSSQMRWELCGSMLLIPISFHANAGFVCSTVNYVFTFACFLWAILPIVEEQRGKRISALRYIYSILLMIFACNMEYYAPPILIVCIVFSVRAFRMKKTRMISLIMTLVCILSLIFAFSAPSGTVAGYNSSDQFFPGYELLSTGEKLQAGFVATAGGLISTSMYGNSFFLATLVFGMLLLICGLGREKKIGAKICYGLPLVITLMTGGLARILPKEHVWRKFFMDAEAGWKWDSKVTLAVAAVFFAAMLFACFRLNRTLGRMCLLALFNRVTMGASRSVFSSGIRTFYPVFFVMCAATAMALRNTQKGKNVSVAIFCIGIIIMYITNFIFVIK